MINTYKNALAATLGTEENIRFTSFALYQGRTEGDLEMNTKNVEVWAVGWVGALWVRVPLLPKGIPVRARLGLALSF